MLREFLVFGVPEVQNNAEQNQNQNRKQNVVQ